MHPFGEGGSAVRPSHPWQALLFIYVVDLAALALLLLYLPLYSTYTLVDWLSAAVFAAAMAASRVMVVGRVDASKIDYGWYMAVEFAMIAVLPVPLACLAHLPGVPVGIIYRLRRKAKEPFRGPDYNVAASIICATVAGFLLQFLDAMHAGSEHWRTAILLPAAALFMLVQYLMLNTLVSLDHRVPWTRTGLFDVNSMIGDVMMILLGALIGRIYELDRSAVLLTIVPLALLQRSLRRIQEAKLVHFDSKTSLFNHRYLDTALSDEVRKATQTGKPLSLIFGDMDYLRDINNTYGHLTGDRALQAVASVFKLHARPGDVAARFGGEEFVMLLPGMEKEQAWEVAERVRRDIAAKRLPTDCGGVFSVTISLGIATFPGDATTVQGLIKAADEAVYKAKRAGKNQVCFYGAGVAI